MGVVSFAGDRIEMDHRHCRQMVVRGINGDTLNFYGTVWLTIITNTIGLGSVFVDLKIAIECNLNATWDNLASKLLIAVLPLE